MSEDPNKMDRDLRKAIVEKMKAAERQRPTLKEFKPFKGKRPHRKYVTIHLHQKQLNYSNNIALGDMFRKSVVRNAIAQSHLEEETCVVLVKDGKVTEEGRRRGIKLP